MLLVGTHSGWAICEVHSPPGASEVPCCYNYDYDYDSGGWDSLQSWAALPLRPVGKAQSGSLTGQTQTGKPELDAGHPHLEEVRGTGSGGDP